VVSDLRWQQTFHIVPSRYPVIALFEEVADPADLETVVALAAATNPRVLDEIGDLRLVRDADRISGPGTTPIMAAFTHAKPSRFGDGSFGIFYAGRDEDTAIAETAYHRGRFLRDARLGSERLDMRVYVAAVRGRYDDIRPVAQNDPRYAPDDYGASRRYGLALYDANAVDGIAFNSVRRRGGTCVAAFRPRRVANCVVSHHLEYRFVNYTLASVLNVEERRR
jgi:RES domain